MLRRIFGKVLGKSEQELATCELHWAAIKGNIRAARREIARGAEVDAKSVNGLTPLYSAAAHGHADILRLLIDHGADVNAGTPGAGSGVALSVAVYFGYKDCARLLMDHGARQDLTDYDRRTPLHIAVYYRRDELAYDILARGVDVNTQNRSGNTPLHEAIGNDNEALAIALVRAGADATAKDRYGAPAEDRAVAREMKDLLAAIQEEKERPQREAEAARQAALAEAAALAAADTLQNDTPVLPPLQVRRRDRPKLP